MSCVVASVLDTSVYEDIDVRPKNWAGLTRRRVSSEDLREYGARSAIRNEAACTDGVDAHGAQTDA